MVRARLKPVFGLLVLFLFFCVTWGKKAKRWTYPRPQWPVPEHRMDAEPCRFFLWNMASAARFCECSRLLESTADRTLWEDSHRQLWLRIPFSSPLLRLFPCQQHSLTRCAKCGHEYRAHVEHALKKTKDRPYDKVVLKMTQQARRKRGAPWFQDYRGVSVFSAKRSARGGAVSGTASTAVAAAGSAGLNGVDNEGGNNGGGNTDGEDFFVGWRRRLVVLAEAQRGTLLQLSGVHVTSTAARAAFKAERDVRLKAEASAERADRKRGRGARIGGGAGGATRGKRYGVGRRGASGGGGPGGGVRRGRSDRARRGGGGGGGGIDSRGKGETEDEVAERNLRAFERMEYI